MMAAVIISNMEPFDPNDDDWETYTENFDIYRTCNNIVASKKVPTFLAVVSKNTYKILKGLCTPQKPASLTYRQIDKLKKIYNLILIQNHISY